MSDKPADVACVLTVKDDRLWCDTHECRHPVGKWEDHKDHRDAIKQIVFRHVLYVGYVCTHCNDGAILID